jgi:steroid delta-isomerase-like uncharacterized protein
MSEANKKLVRRWFEEVWNNKNQSAIDEMLCDASKSNVFPETDSALIGPEDFKIIHQAYVQAFPDLKFTIEELIAEGDRVAVRWSVQMTHLGGSLGIPATGRKLRQQGTSFLTVRDNFLQEGWNDMDMHSLLQQLQ